MRPITSLLLAAAALLAGFYSGFHYELGKAASAASPAAASAFPSQTQTGRPNQGSGGGGAAAGGSGGTGSGAASSGGGFGGAGGGSGGGGFGRGSIGTVQSVAGDVLTITDNQGNQVKVSISTASLQKSVKAGKEDLVQGATVAVQGQRNADGTITATQVTLTPPRAG